MVKFISALRASGVRISLAESSDAFHAVEELGIKNRNTFRLSLRTTLVKEAQDIPTFEELFPLFFDNAETPPLMDMSKDLSPQETEMLAKALRQFNEELRRMLERLIRGEQLSQEELKQLGQLVGLDRADDLRYREWMVRRMEQAMRSQEVREAVEELMELMQQLGMNKQRMEQMRQLLQANQEALEEQLRQYAGQQIAENMSQQPPDDSIEGLLNQPFSSLSEKDMDRLRKEVQRLAATLRTRVALRQKRAKNGQLDAKATIRANLKHGNVPIDIRRRDRVLKPKMVVICDISTSMRHCSELMLNLIFAMQDQISKTHAFAFIDHLEYISPDFHGKDSQNAVNNVLERMPSGYYNTDLGHSLDTFTHEFLDTMDSRTIFIVVGDGRNNYNDPRHDLFTHIARRSRRTIWLNPESPAMWGTGDSDMLKYASACDMIFQVSNLAELTSAIDRLMS
ncbi:MAG: VWA domain-containing protein [Chloroflexota bacterium]|nr:MAG: VWA domain-containing protein [Chloroflexota bacterium]